MRGRSLLVLAAVAVGVAACGLSVVGEGPVGGPEADASASPDGSSGGAGPTPTGSATTGPGSPDAAPDAPPVGCQGDACALPTATGAFTLALFGDRSAACPAGFTQADAIENPVAQDGSCGCGACTATGVTCNTGTIGTRYSADTDCDSNGASITANNNTCLSLSANFASTYASIVPPSPVTTSATCSAASAPVRANVGVDEVRLCTKSPSTCADDACARPGSLAACLVADGDVACPAGTPTKHLVGSDFGATCGACTCTVQASCGGSVTFYSSGGCTGTARKLDANVCTQVNQASIASYRYVAVVNQACTATPPLKATVALTGTKTVCCP